MARFYVTDVQGNDNGCIAHDWEIHPSGALIFWKDISPTLREFVIAYAPGSWTNFWQDDA